METDSKQRRHKKFYSADEYCICPECGERILHVKGEPCRSQPCPKCGKKMYREGSYHHQQWLKKNQEKTE